DSRGGMLCRRPRLVRRAEPRPDEADSSFGSLASPSHYDTKKYPRSAIYDLAVDDRSNRRSPSREPRNRKSLNRKSPNRKSKMDMSAPHVVIIGGGFGGLDAARALASAPVRVTIID